KGIRAIVPPALGFTAERVLKSNLQNNTADNAVNAIRSTGRLPKGYAMNNFLTSSTRWFITTDMPDGLIMQTRESIQFDQDMDFGTFDTRFKAFERYVPSWIEAKGIYGSEGV